MNLFFFYNMLSDKEFLRLQQLANIKLSAEEQVKLGKQLDNIIQFIGQLDQIKITLNHQKNEWSEGILDDWGIPTIWEAVSSNKMKKLQTSKTVVYSSTKKTKQTELTLRTIAGTRTFPNTEKLLDNVKHPLVNNSIVIKSALS